MSSKVCEKNLPEKRDKIEKRKYDFFSLDSMGADILSLFFN
jgi:hypothetical protein